MRHENRAAQVLERLNNAGTRLVMRTVSEIVRKKSALGRDEPIRILDVGCGASPYLRSDEFTRNQNLSLTLVDKNPEVIDGHWAKNEFTYPATLLASDFLTMDLNALKPPGDYYDVVILGFVLHELRAQLAFHSLGGDVGLGDRGTGVDSAETLFRRCSESPFVGPDTVILQADVFHWPFWDAATLDEARQLQFSELGHADPAAAFLLPPEVLGYAARAGLVMRGDDQEAYNVVASVDLKAMPSDDPAFEKLQRLCQDPEYGPVFTTRRAYCVRLGRAKPAATGGPPSTAVPRRRRNSLPEVIEKNLAGDARLQKKKQEHLDGLRDFLKGNETVTVRHYDQFLGNGLFDVMAHAAGKLAQDWFSTSQITGPLGISFWFGMDSLTLEESRYSPKRAEDKWWQCHHADLEGTGENGSSVRVDIGYRRDWTSLCFNYFSSADAVKQLAKDNKWLLDLRPPSVYRWMMDAGEDQAGHAGQPTLDKQGLRSVTISCLSDSEEGSEHSPAHLIEDALIMQRYRHYPTRHSNPVGVPLRDHLLIPLPGDYNEATTLGRRLDQICSGFYCSDAPGAEVEAERAKTAVLHGISSVYIDSIFLARGHVSERPPRIEDLLDGFRKRWLANPIVRFFNASASAREVLEAVAAGQVLLPEAMRERIEQFIERVGVIGPVVSRLPVVWTSFIVRLPGSDYKPIATVMFMCDRPFNPALLELFKAQFQEVFFSIREVEAERIVRQHTRSRTVQTMLRSFGHDGRRFADGITLALGQGTNIGELDADERMAIGKWLAQNLASRLYVYQTLIGDEEITNSFYSDEKNRKLETVELSDLIRREVAFLLLRSAVEESEFKLLAERLDLAAVKEPLIRFAKEATHSGESYPSYELRALEHSVQSILELSWDGFEGVRIPTKLNPDGNRTAVSRISAGLGFIMSELLTNVFRHQFSKYRDLKKRLPLSLSFSFRRGDAGYELEVRSKPAFYAGMTKSNPTGLASLVFIANALQVKIEDKELSSGNNAMSFPFPRFDEETGEQVSLITGISEDALM